MPNTNRELINKLIEDWTLKNPLIIDSFYKIRREDFILPWYKNKAYTDSPLPISGSATISQPTTVAFMLELLNPKKQDKVLDIWAWSGWTTALLAKIVWNSWYVEWTEIDENLVNFWNNNIQKYNLKNCKISKAEKNTLWIPNKKFDKILVSASAEYIPENLTKQLKQWWNMVIPIKEEIQKVYKSEKNTLDIKKYYGFVFIPLQY